MWDTLDQEAKQQQRAIQEFKSHKAKQDEGGSTTPMATYCYLSIPSGKKANPMEDNNKAEVHNVEVEARDMEMQMACDQSKIFEFWEPEPFQVIVQISSKAIQG